VCFYPDLIKRPVLPFGGVVLGEKKIIVVMEDNIQEFVCCHYTEPKIRYSVSNHALSSNCSSPLKLVLYHFDCKGYLHSRETGEQGLTDLLLFAS